eukprot:Rhum_TRINITY_DN2383_c0_g1::Rhum_TRINITY_DN2383_c0_g1_i1::g.7019::m.7019
MSCVIYCAVTRRSDVDESMRQRAIKKFCINEVYELCSRFGCVQRLVLFARDGIPGAFVEYSAAEEATAGIAGVLKATRFLDVNLTTKLRLVTHRNTSRHWDADWGEKLESSSLGQRPPDAAVAPEAGVGTVVRFKGDSETGSQPLPRIPALHKLFSHHGEVTRITVGRGACLEGLAVFASRDAASDAAFALDGKRLYDGEPDVLSVMVSGRPPGPTLDRETADHSRCWDSAWDDGPPRDSEEGRGLLGPRLDAVALARQLQGLRAEMDAVKAALEGASQSQGRGRRKPVGRWDIPVLADSECDTEDE